MRTLIIIASGLVLLALFIGVARALASGDKLPVVHALRAFIALWLVLAAGNMWMGVVKAGYGVWEELPVFLVIFGLPAAIAFYIHWRIS